MKQCYNKTMPKIRMPKLKAKIKQLFTSKKPILALVLFFIILGIIVPVHQTNAIAPWLAALLTKVGLDALNVLGEVAVIILGLILVTFLGNFLLSLAVSLLELVTSPGFISLSYTNPVNNKVLELGWGATRDLVNIGFVIVLIIIGLATALRIKEYQWQKTLPRLIAIILLVNFTPVIIGAIVDASNIVMNELLGREQEWGLFVVIAERDIGIGTLKIATAIVKPSMLAELFVLWMYCYTTAAILFLYSALFILRYVAIWILVILSPLAFFAYILPGTRQYFRMWWRQLLNWCFIGVVAGFFLWLSNILLTGTAGKTIIPIKGGVSPERVEGGGFFNIVLPYLIVVVFLYIGFFFGFKTSAYGAGAVVSWAQKKGRAGIAGVKRWTGRKARRVVPRAVGEEKFRKLAEKLATARGPLGLGRLVRPLGRGMLRLPEAEIREADTAEADAKNKSVARNISELRKEILLPGMGSRGGRLAGMAAAGQAKDAEKILSAKEIAKTITGLVKLGRKGKEKAEKIAAGFSSYLIKAGFKPKDLGFEFDRTTPEGREEERKYEEHAREHRYYDRGAYWGKLLAEARTVEEIQGFKGLLTSDKPEHRWAQEVINKFWDPTQLRRAGEEIGSAFIDKFQDATKPEWWYLKENRGMHKFLSSTAAQSAGFSFSTPEAERIRGMSREQIKTELSYIQREFEGMHPGPEKEDLIRRIDTYQKELARKEREEREAAEAAEEKKPKKEERPKEKPRTGEAGARRKRAPRTGEEGKKEAKVPFMITRKMKQELKKKGYTDEEIRKMTPEEAWEKLGGMPE